MKRALNRWHRQACRHYAMMTAAAVLGTMSLVALAFMIFAPAPSASILFGIVTTFFGFIAFQELTEANALWEKGEDSAEHDRLHQSRESNL